MARTEDVGQDFTDPSFTQAVQNANDKAAAADAAATRANAAADDAEYLANHNIAFLEEDTYTVTLQAGSSIATSEGTTSEGYNYLQVDIT